MGLTYGLPSMLSQFLRAILFWDFGNWIGNFLDLTTGIQEFFEVYDWDPGIFEVYLTLSFPGPEEIPGISLTSSKGEWALESPHFLGTLAAVSVSGLTGPPTSDLRILLLLAYQAWSDVFYLSLTLRVGRNCTKRPT